MLIRMIALFPYEFHREHSVDNQDNNNLIMIRLLAGKGSSIRFNYLKSHKKPVVESNNPFTKSQQLYPPNTSTRLSIIRKACQILIWSSLITSTLTSGRTSITVKKISLSFSIWLPIKIFWPMVGYY